MPGQAIAVPVCGIAGEKDGERKHLERMQGVVPGYTLTIIPKAGHDGVRALLAAPGFERRLRRAGLSAFPWFTPASFTKSPNVGAQEHSRRREGSSVHLLFPALSKSHRKFGTGVFGA